MTKTYLRAGERAIFNQLKETQAQRESVRGRILKAYDRLSSPPYSVSHEAALKAMNDGSQAAIDKILEMARQQEERKANTYMGIAVEPTPETEKQQNQ